LSSVVVAIGGEDFFKTLKKKVIVLKDWYRGR
jgi:hypothetical protein